LVSVTVNFFHHLLIMTELAAKNAEWEMRSAELKSEEQKLDPKLHWSRSV
jgi:hypothetical protein